LQAHAPRDAQRNVRVWLLNMAIFKCA